VIFVGILVWMLEANLHASGYTMFHQMPSLLCNSIYLGKIRLDAQFMPFLGVGVGVDLKWGVCF
jgi:hypothetical protein